MSKLSKPRLCLLVLSFVFFLNPSGAVGQEGCIVPTMPENVEGIEKLLALQWEPGHPPAEIEPGTNAVVKVVGGIPPLQWSVSGNGFSLGEVEEKGVDRARSKLLKASPTACGPATITVTDALEDTETGYVRCTAGRWVKKGDYCGLSGSVGCYSVSGDLVYYSLTSGYQKQEQQTRFYGSYKYRVDCDWCAGFYAANPCGSTPGTSSTGNCIDGDHEIPGYNCCDTDYYWCRFPKACRTGWHPDPAWHSTGECQGTLWSTTVECYCVADINGVDGLQYYEWQCP
jgi:hypothetical protein